MRQHITWLKKRELENLLYRSGKFIFCNTLSDGSV
jgi:hypothetical protein